VTTITAIVAVAGSAVAASHLLELIALGVAALRARRHRRINRAVLREAAVGSGELIGISVALPARGAAEFVISSIERLLASPYPDLELIAVVDSSNGATLEALVDRFDLRPADPRPCGNLPTGRVRAVFSTGGTKALLVVDKRGADRGDALNAALNFATRPLFLATEPQVVMEDGALVEAALPFSTDPDTVATLGTVLVTASGGEGLPSTVVGCLHHLHEVRRTLLTLSVDALVAHVPGSACFTLFARSALIGSGGFEPFTVDPERDVVLRFGKQAEPGGTSARIVRAVDAVVRSPAADRWADHAQRVTRGQPETARLPEPIARGLVRRRLGALGMLWLSLAFMGVGMAVVELVGWLALAVGLIWGMTSLGAAIFFLAGTVGLGLAVSLAAVLFEVLAFGALAHASEKVRVVAIALSEQLGPRQLELWWRIRTRLGRGGRRTATA